MEKITDINKLKELARQIRKDILFQTYCAGSGHPGGSLSAVEVMTALFFNIMNHDPKNPQDPGRDRFILSKGHCTPVYYSVLARTGYIPIDELSTFRKMNSRLQGHPDRSKLSIIETSSGSLGQGLSIASGIALTLRLDNINSKVFCLLGDGELDEGQVWESLATIKKYCLNNLIIIVDNNKIQLDGFNKDIKDLEPLNEKFKTFGFNVIEIDGNNIEQVIDGLSDTIISSNDKKVSILLCHTIKGKGVSFMENTPEWHGKAPDKEQYENALKELG